MWACSVGCEGLSVQCGVGKVRHVGVCVCVCVCVRVRVCGDGGGVVSSVLSHCHNFLTDIIFAKVVLEPGVLMSKGRRRRVSRLWEREGENFPFLRLSVSMGPQPNGS